MKSLVLAMGLLVALPSWSMAAEFSDPKALVDAIYAQFTPGAPKADLAEFYSTRLKAIDDDAKIGAVYASDAAMSGSAFKAEPTFNPFLPDDNALLFDLVVGQPTLLDDRAVVNVSYHNFDKPHLLALSLVRENGNWKVDDVASLGGQTPWLLSWALASDPYKL